MAPAATDTTAPAATTAAPGATTPAPLNPTPGVKPLAVVDGGKPADAGAVTIDGGVAPVPTPAIDGGAAPAPTPKLTIPTAIPGFDAGAFKPPPGFPTALPSGLIPPQKK